MLIGHRSCDIYHVTALATFSHSLLLEGQKQTAVYYESPHHGYREKRLVGRFSFRTDQQPTVLRRRLAGQEQPITQGWHPGEDSEDRPWT